MKYYIITVEQVYNESGQLSEYATKSDGYSEKEATSKFFDKCAAINKDLSPNGHAFAVIKIMNSIGGVIKEEKIGSYVNQ